MAASARRLCAVADLDASRVPARAARSLHLLRDHEAKHQNEHEKPDDHQETPP